VLAGGADDHRAKLFLAFTANTPGGSRLLALSRGQVEALNE
jgi:hypothetical protein